jgi:hypothetical protein
MIARKLRKLCREIGDRQHPVGPGDGLLFMAGDLVTGLLSDPGPVRQHLECVPPGVRRGWLFVADAQVPHEPRQPLSGLHEARARLVGSSLFFTAFQQVG